MSEGTGICSEQAVPIPFVCMKRVSLASNLSRQALPADQLRIWHIEMIELLLTLCNTISLFLEDAYVSAL